EQTYDVIAVLTAYAKAAPAVAPALRPVLVGAIDGDYQSWWIEQSPSPTNPVDGIVRFLGAQGPIDAPARVRPIPHSAEGRLVHVAVPEGVAGLAALSLETPAGSHLIPTVPGLAAP